MDLEKLRDLIGKCKTANYQAGLNEGRAEASKEVCKSFDAELEWYLQECEAESKKPIVFHAEPLPPPPPSERRCRNCANFLWIPPENRETATSGKCYERNVGTEFCDANEDLDHSWCDRWKPMEEEPKKTPEQTLEELGKALAGACPTEAEAPSDEEEDKEDDGDDRCGDCLYFDRRKNWCTGHNMPAIQGGNVCPDFLARSSVKCRECASFALEKWCHKGLLTLSVGESEACPSFKPRGNA